MGVKSLSASSVIDSFFRVSIVVCAASGPYADQFWYLVSAPGDCDTTIYIINTLSIAKNHANDGGKDVI